MSIVKIEAFKCLYIKNTFTRFENNLKELYYYDVSAFKYLKAILNII